MLLYNVAPPQISSPVMSHPLLNSVRVLIFYFAESLSQGVQEGVRLNFLYGGVRSNGNLSLIAQPRTYPQLPLSFANGQLFGGALYSTFLLSTLYPIAIYSPGQQKKFNYLASIRDIELKYWG